MKIAIVTLTTTNKQTGVAEYLINLIRELQRIDQTNQYYIFTARDNRYMFSVHANNFREVILPLTDTPTFIMRPAFHFWQIFILPIWCRIKKIDLIHLPNTLLVTGWFPTVSTLHDVVEYKARKYSAIRTYCRKLMVRSAIKHSIQIITVSNSSARDIKSLGAKKVTAIHLGFRNPYTLLDLHQERDDVLRRYNLLDVPYVLFVGTMLKHKNVPTLIASFARIKKEHPATKLVVVGSRSNDFENVRRTIKHHDLKDDVYLLNYIAEREKLIILKNAKIFCLISSYEGFGIPVLEAQSAGVPVIVNNVSSLPEVGGEGVLLVDPSNLEEETACGISSLLQDVEARNYLIEKGFENILRFSWEILAKRTLNAYQESKEK